MTFQANFLMGAIPLRIRFNKIDGFIKIHNKIRYLVLFHEWCDKICDMIKYLISEKSNITGSINHNFTRIRIDSNNSLTIVRILTFNNAIILIKSLSSKNKNNYYYNIVLEKVSYKDTVNPIQNIFK